MNAHLQRLVLIGAGVLVVTIAAAVAIVLNNRETVDEIPAPADPAQTALEYEQQLREEENQVQENINKSRERQQQLEPGDKAPGFTLRGEGGRISLSDYEGRPLVIEFAQSSCPHCQNMAPIFDGVMGAHPDVAYLIVGVAEPPAATRSWHESFLGKPMRGDLAFDPDLKAGKLYDVAGTPTTVFIKPDGTIMEILAGEMSRDELSRKVAQLAEA